MTEQALTIPFTGSESSALPSSWLNLEQEYIPEIVQEANLYDLLQMFSMARSGLSAQTYRKTDCPVLITGKNTATVTLDFYVWPSAIDLPYSLTSGGGVISPPERVELVQDFDLVLPLSETVELGYLISGASWQWLTPAINKDGAVVAVPELHLDGGQLLIGDPVFGVVRMSGIANGYRHSVAIKINGTDGNRIQNIHESIIATWVDDNGKTATTTLDLKIPDCVADALSACPEDGTWETLGTITSVGTTPVVYYSSCTGQIIEVRYE